MHTDYVESGVSGVSCCGSCPCALHLAAGSLIPALSLLFLVRITPDRNRHTFFYTHMHTHIQYRHHHPTYTASHRWSCQTQNVICREQTTDVLQHKGCIVYQAGSLVVYIPGEKHTFFTGHYNVFGILLYSQITRELYITSIYITSSQKTWMPPQYCSVFTLEASPKNKLIYFSNNSGCPSYPLYFFPQCGCEIGLKLHS